jgi:hypothetical protein
VTNSAAPNPPLWDTYTIGTGISDLSTNWVTTTTNTTGIDWGVGSAVTRPAARLSLQGDDADIDINGKSMTAWMKNIEERLNILTVNAELESEWQELKELGEQYRALEKHIQEKMKTWTKLRAMDTDNR